LGAPHCRISIVGFYCKIGSLFLGKIYGTYGEKSFPMKSEISMGKKVGETPQILSNPVKSYTGCFNPSEKYESQLG